MFDITSFARLLACHVQSRRRALTASDRSSPLWLIRNVERDQQLGVGVTARRGAWVEIKDSWVIGPTGRWALKSSGIVIRGCR
jgi:hypothetical protein